MTPRPRTPRQTLARDMSEADLQRGVTEALEWRGWWVWHATDPTMSAPGLPDVLAIHPRHRVIALAELKTETGSLRPAQRDLLLRVGTEPLTAWTCLWRPSTYDPALAWILHPDGPPPTAPLPPPPAPRAPYPLRTRRTWR